MWSNNMYHNITHSIAAEPKSDFKVTKDTPYLALTGELRGVSCEKTNRIITAAHYNVVVHVGGQQWLSRVGSRGLSSRQVGR